MFGYLGGGSVWDFEENKILCGLIAKIESENLNNELKKKLGNWENIWKAIYKKILMSLNVINFFQIHRRDEMGRFEVQMPFKKEPVRLGESKNIALQKRK